MSDRPVVTGIGVTAPNGLGTEDYWAATWPASAASAEDPSTPPAIRAGWPARLRLRPPPTGSRAGCCRRPTT
jgi:act minimal PKS chain-length factor (CLF/KS beta)